MKQLVLLAVCFIVMNANEVKINNNGYYWKDWDVKKTVPADAVPGGLDESGHKTFIARTVYPTIGVIVPGKACQNHQKMWFEFGNLEHESTQDVSILCSLNHNRFYWILITVGDLVSNVEKNQKVLIIAGHDRPKPIAIGKKTIGNEIHIGKVVIDDVTKRFMGMRVTKDGKGWGIFDSYEVLVYDSTPVNCDNLIVKLPVNN